MIHFVQDQQGMTDRIGPASGFFELLIIADKSGSLNERAYVDECW
jgi:hypothetical protein